MFQKTLCVLVHTVLWRPEHAEPTEWGNFDWNPGFELGCTKEWKMNGRQCKSSKMIWLDTLWRLHNKSQSLRITSGSDSELGQSEWVRVSLAAAAAAARDHHCNKSRRVRLAPIELQVKLQIQREHLKCRFITHIVLLVVRRFYWCSVNDVIQLATFNYQINLQVVCCEVWCS